MQNLRGVGSMATLQGTTSRTLHILDRKTGAVVWSVDAEYGFFHNAVAAGNGKLFTLDRINWHSPGLESESVDGAISPSRAPERRSAVDHSDKPAVLTAYEMESGEVLWRRINDGGHAVFGTWLAYSARRDMVVECYRGNRDYFESGSRKTRMQVWRGTTGERVWRRFDEEGWSYAGGPVMLVGDVILCQSGHEIDAVNLLNGEKYRKPSPLTGEPMEFRAHTRYGCGHKLACQNAMFFRSGSAGYFDLANHAGVGNFGGFKSGCTVNMIPADGMLVCPEYTRTCGCSYQLQTSCAMVHRPEGEVWTRNAAVGREYLRRGGRLRSSR